MSLDIKTDYIMQKIIHVKSLAGLVLLLAYSPICNSELPLELPSLSQCEDKLLWDIPNKNTHMRPRKYNIIVHVFFINSPV